MAEHLQMDLEDHARAFRFALATLQDERVLLQQIVDEVNEGDRTKGDRLLFALADNLQIIIRRWQGENAENFILGAIQVLQAEHERRQR